MSSIVYALVMAAAVANAVTGVKSSRAREELELSSVEGQTCKPLEGEEMEMKVHPPALFCYFLLQ